MPDLSLQQQFADIQSTLADLLIGHEVLIERMLIAALAGGHLLVEGAPGLAKTRAVKHFAAMTQTDFVRIQSTPDLLPADLTGTNVFHQERQQFEFAAGPLFNNIVLVDEVNRAPPKVQSALLEAMAEHQISSGGVTRDLEQPFIVIATQNPIEHEGTYPLPEAQLDRFMFFVEVQMPDAADERRILDLVLSEQSGSSADATPGSESAAQHHQQLLQASDILHARTASATVHVSEAVRDYVVRLVCATRGHGAGAISSDTLAYPASPRGSIFLATAAQARAWLQQRDHVVPEDIQALAPDVLCGRLGLSYPSQAAGLQARDLVRELLDKVPVL